MALTRLLLVDDDQEMRDTLATLLTHHDFVVTTAADVPSALKLILSDTYDVLLSDLHMPGAGDGLTVASAMHHANPGAVTLLLSAFPEMRAAARAILLQADEVLLKPISITSLVDVIRTRLKSGAQPIRAIVPVATILEDSIESTISRWYDRVEADEKLMVISLTREQRTEHLPQIMIDLVTRLRSVQTLGSRELSSAGAREHGALRRKQGYSAAMLVEESRMLQVSIFGTLRTNLGSIDFSMLLDEVMTIADEVDSQLSQAMDSYMAVSQSDVARTSMNSASEIEVLPMALLEESEVDQTAVLSQRGI